ncbi:hypothetical protein [Aurantimonas sp. 22II-16-19i]|uniref:hypothetical protein n=1 Tax=Aurantimonas sp. 22II-16-19i TaxID=1317114 RepID=UPI0009F7FCEB|nr:hypothetical protein [Aurantimonas sp. 22II-16-19i]ORE92787.1 hypothetical protein ATO4_16380 [Aurantimonas sp. 22II-16-19i]
MTASAPQDPATTATFTLRPGGYDTREIGEFAAPSGDFRLAHMPPVGKNEHCRRVGRTDLCGHYAWQSSNNLLASSDLTCRRVAPAAGADPASCRLADGTDLAAWLLRSGWARAAPHAPDPYPQLEAEAPAKAIGIVSRP